MTDIVKGALRPKTFNAEWKIKRCFAYCDKVGDCYTSPAFSMSYANNITDWYLRVYPKGSNEKNKDHITIFLNFASETGIQVTVDYQFSVVSKQNSLPTARKFTAVTFKGPSQGSGFNLVKQNIIKDTNNGALIDDALTILCDITFHSIDPNIDVSLPNYDKWLAKIYENSLTYEELFESGSFSDVTFNVLGNKIPSHKAILSCGSPVFRAMFEHDMKEREQNSVDIADVDYKVMKELLRFMYSGDVKDMEKIAGDLLIAADKYSMDALKALCETHLYHELTVDSVVENLKLTDMCDTIHLKTLVVKFAAAHYKDVIKKPGFAGLNSNVMYQVMQAIAEKE